MLIRLARDHWINLTLDNVREISVEKDNDDNNFYIAVDTIDNCFLSDNYFTWHEAAAFALDIVAKINAEAKHET